MMSFNSSLYSHLYVLLTFQFKFENSSPSSIDWASMDDISASKDLCCLQMSDSLTTTPYNSEAFFGPLIHLVGTHS